MFSVSGTSDSETGSSSSSSSSEEETLARPVFLKKRTEVSTEKKTPLLNSALQKAERLQKVEHNTLEKLPFDGVDDTDNLCPEEEYKAWKLREKARKERDMARIREAEEIKEDAVRRKLAHPNRFERYINDPPQQTLFDIENNSVGNIEPKKLS